MFCLFVVTYLAASLSCTFNTQGHDAPVQPVFHRNSSDALCSIRAGFEDGAALMLQAASLEAEAKYEQAAETYNKAAKAFEKEGKTSDQSNALGKSAAMYEKEVPTGCQERSGSHAGRGCSCGRGQRLDDHKGNRRVYARSRIRKWCPTT